jgi:hypothetical protein
MKVLLLAIAALMLLTSVANSQSGGRVELYPDAQMSSCSLVDNGPDVVEVHIFHTNIREATAIQFAAPVPACWVGAVWLGDVIVVGLPTGDTQNEFFGISIGYMTCLQLPVYIGYMNFFTAGVAQTCCIYTAVGATGAPSGQIEVIDCDLHKLYAVGGELVINPDQTCPCTFPIPVSNNTWGAVKALYR